MSQPCNCSCAQSFSCDKPAFFRSLFRLSPIFRSRLIFCSMQMHPFKIDLYRLQLHIFCAILEQNIDRNTGQKMGVFIWFALFLGIRIHRAQFFPNLKRPLNIKLRKKQSLSLHKKSKKPPFRTAHIDKTQMRATPVSLAAFATAAATVGPTRSSKAWGMI